MSRERTPLAELEVELKRQDQLFKNACETLAALADGVRLSIPEHVLDELDAAFEAQRVAQRDLRSPYAMLRA